MLHTNELLASDAMRNVVESLRQSYDYIIVDLPPLIPVIDARVTTNFVDAFLYVLEWGRSRIDAAKTRVGQCTGDLRAPHRRRHQQGGYVCDQVL